MKLNRSQVLRHLVFSKGKKYVVSLLGIIGFYDLVVAQFIPREFFKKLPRIIELILAVHLAWYWWTIILISTMLLFVFESLSGEIIRLNQQINLSEDEPPEIEELGILSTEGVNIRNSWKRFSVLETPPDFQAVYEDWNERTLEVIARLSRGKAQYFRTLDRWRWLYSVKFNREHERYLNIIDEKVKRLGAIIESYIET